MDFDLDKIKMLAFDCDGTLLNTIPDYTYCMNKALDEFSLPHITQDEAKTFLGYGTDKFIRCALKGQIPDKIEEFKDAYLRNYSEHFFVLTQIYPDVTKLLTLAKAKGYKLAVCSNKPDFILQKLIKSAFPTIDFDFVSGQKKQGVTKPDPYLLNELCDTFSLGKSEIMYFGDTEADALFAKNAFVKSLFIVTYGFRDKNFLMEHTNPVMFFNYVEDIIRFLGL